MQKGGPRQRVKATLPDWQKLDSNPGPLVPDKVFFVYQIPWESIIFSSPYVSVPG
jgi:hypothetical protein